MSNYLHPNEYLPHAPDGSGEQVKINHADCPAGEDTKQRLYIKRCDDGITILAYCHHCGGRGKYNTFATANIATAKTRFNGSRSVRTKSIHYPSGVIKDTSRWPSAARAWLYRYGITNEEIKDYGIFYNPSLLRVGIPVFGSIGLVALQYRRIFDEPQDMGPKYTTVTTDNVPLYHSRGSATGSTVVICEDAISAIKCGRILPAVALIGVFLNESHVKELVDNYDRFLIFLDDDNTTVRMQQLILKNRLDVFGEAKIVHTDRDPKAYSEEELRRILICT